MAKVIGIDLGTTNSVVAYEDDADVRVVLNQANERSTPSVVGLHKDKKSILIGTPALDFAEREAENTIFSIKRLMSRFFADPNVQEAMSRYKYRIVKAEDGDDVRVLLGERSYSPVEISALILEKLKQDAESRLGEEVTHAVITVPAYFSVSQKQATRTAGELAGLRVKKIIDEPTAAAMAFGVSLKPGEVRTVLVYDLGGGTFDISILFISGEVFNQIGIEGDMWLGGDDFDHAVMNHVLQAVREEYDTDPSSNNRFMVRLKREAEKAKRELSGMISTSLAMIGLVPIGNGGWGDVDVELSRRDFEDLQISSGTIKFGGVDREFLREWCEDLKINARFSDHSAEIGPDTVRNRIKKSILLCRKAMLGAGVTKEQIDHVLLVGGSTTMPLVQKMLEQEFGPEKIMRNIDPMACVAMGAGIAANRIQGIVCENVLGKDAEGKDIYCLEVNDINATVCRNAKCKAPLTAQKRCRKCNTPNEIDAEKCVACSTPFKRIDAGNITPKPVGILAAEDKFEIIVPKSTPYPTPEPVIVPFRTAESSQKAVFVPIYHAEVDEFDPKNLDQWIGEATIPLEGEHLPAGTRVDVSVLIDRDCCLEIEAMVKDGSGRRVKVFIDLRIRSATGPGPANGTEGNDKSEQPYSQGEIFAMWYVLAAEIALRDYEWLFNDHRTTQKLQQLAGRGRQAMDRRDEREGLEAAKQIETLLNDNLKNLMLLIYAELASLNQHLEPAQRSQLRSQIKELVDALKSNAQQQVLQGKYDRLSELTQAANNVGPVEERPVDVTRLTRLEQ